MTECRHASDRRSQQPRAVSLVTSAKTTDVFIYGSCVSRDSFEYLDMDRFQLVEYVARQSLASAFAGPGEPAFDTSTLESQFQRRVLDLDAASGLPRQLRSAADTVDLLLWDLFDERLGYYARPDGTVVTNTVELIRWSRETGLEPSGRLVPYGSREHLRAFTRRLEDFRTLLDETGLRDRVVLVAPSWARVTETDDRTPSSFGITAQRANVLTLPYLQAVRDTVQPGLIISPPLALTRAASDHQWGIAPFHYVPEVYRYITDALEDLAASPSIPDELARHRTAREREGRLVPAISRVVTRFLTRSDD